MRLQSRIETRVAIAATLLSHPAKESDVMPTPVYAAQGTSIVRRPAVALAVAGVVVIFIAGALVRSPIGSPRRFGGVRAAG